LQLWVNFIIKSKHNFFEIALSPFRVVVVTFNLTLMASCSNSVNWQVVQLLEVLLDFWFAQKVVGAEADGVVAVLFL
jgi:hypothetical protein